MPAITVHICDKFTAIPGDIIQWTNVPPSGCTVSQDGPGVWPFTAPSPIILPAPGGVGVKPGLTPGTYCFIVSCCEKARVCLTIT